MDLADVDHAVSRSARYFLDDGLWDIAVGLWLALTVAVPVLIGGEIAQWAGLPMLLGGAAVRPLVLAAKSRWVFPRTGRVTYAPPGSRGSRWGVVSAAALAAAVAALLALSLGQPLGDAAGHAVTGVVLGTGFLYAAWRWGQRRWNLLAIAMPALGALVASSGLERRPAIAAHAAGAALLLIASGAFAFASYLRRAPRPEGAGDER